MEVDKKWGAATLLILSETIGPKEISKILNTEASDSYLKGDIVRPKYPNSPRRQENKWILYNGLNDPCELEDHIEKHILFIEEKTEELKNLISTCEIVLFCSFSSSSGQGGFVLSSDMIKRLSVLPIDLILDLYPPGETGQE